jgi:hypothetical protein
MLTKTGMIDLMTVYLDDESVKVSGDTLGPVLQEVSQRLDPAGRIVVEVLLNGEALIGDQLAQLKDAPIGNDELRLYSADPVELAVEVLHQVRAQLDDARQAQQEAADLFQRDQAGQALQRVTASLSVWQQAQQAVLQTTQMVGLDLDQQVFEGHPVGSIIQSLLGQLMQVRDLLTAHDTVGLADALAYEWPETVDRWQRLVSQLIQWIEQR